MKVSMDPGSMTQDPNESQKHIENFNNAIGTAKALDPVSVKAFENTAGKRGIILYDPHTNPGLASGEPEEGEKAPTYLPTHIFDREYDPQRTSLIQQLRAKAIESAINSSNTDNSEVSKVASPEGSGGTGPQPQQTNTQPSLPPLDTEIKNKLRQTTSGLIQKQMQLIESNPNVKKSVLSQLANQGLIAGHTPSTIAKITNPQDISLLYQRITGDSSAAGGAMKKFIQGIAAKQLGDRIRSYPGTDLQVLLKNRNDRSDATGILEKLAETLTYLSQISTSTSNSTKGSPAANQNTNKGGSPQATKTNGPLSK